MITEPTVLILGAGASYPYGFPTAKELKGSICNAFSRPETHGCRLLGLNSSFSPDAIFEFREAFWRSGQPSIDAFLEYRRDLLPIGKLAIAFCLIPFEDEKNLYQPDLTRGGDWYEYLSIKLTASFEDFGANKLSIITFNYDRSLEYYLFTALRNLHNESALECADKLAQIPIIHVYGQLGRQSYPQPESVEYAPDNERFTKVRNAAAGITLLHEEASDLAQACKLLTDASRICFLGFSYHPLNLERLQLKDSGARQVFGTVRGLIGAEVTQVEAKLHSVLLTANVGVNDDDSLHFLRRHLILG